jgi:RNA polymerase sigma factor (sigma-70 family)
MEVSALKHSGRGGLHARSPLLRLQSDERLVAVIRRGNTAAFELLVSRYETRLLSFCRHLLRSREDAEDVLQEVLAAAYNAMLSDERPINVRPWLYRIARNRCLNHLRRIQAVGVDSMDVHFSDNGASTADKVHDREEFRQLVGDIHGLPETQRTALVLREMDALSYEQIAEAMDTTVPSVKSLLVRARVSLAEASEARLLTCDEVREELGEAAEGLIKKPSPAVRRHVKSCIRCERFEKEIRHSSKALAAALVPISAVGLLRKLLLVHLLGHSAGSGAAGAAGASATGTGAAAGAAGAAGAGAAGAAGGAGSAGLIGAGVGAVATKAAAGLAAAALVTAGTVAVSHDARHHSHQPTGLQVLTSAVSAGVAHSEAIAPRLAAPVRELPPAKPAKQAEPRGHGARTATPARPVLTSLEPDAVRTASMSPTSTAAAAAVTNTTPPATAASVATTTPSSVTPTTASATTPTTPGTATTTSTATTTTTAPAETTTTAAATTPTATTPASTTSTSTTPTSTTPTPITVTTTTPSSSPVTGGTGIVRSAPVTTVAATVSPTPSP